MKKLVALFFLMASAGTASAQSVAELRAQLEQTRTQIAQAEAAGVDPALIESLRESMAIAEESIREMEADQATAPAPAPAPSPAAPATSAYATKPNALEGDPACSGFTLANYRQRGLEGGNDVQLKTMCAQAFDLYASYLNAIRQGYSEADANRTHAAHTLAARNASSFYANNRAEDGASVK